MKKRPGSCFYLLRILLFALLFMGCCAALCLFGLKISGKSFVDFRLYNYFANSTGVFSEGKELPVVVIDAGHGGMDSGAVSVLGDEEKDLNLAVAKKLGAFLELGGIRVIYTRQDDTMLDDGIKGNPAKISDLRGRVLMAREYPNAVFVSIHMNTLPIEKYKGLQVFYSPNNEKSKILALVLQNETSSMLQEGNTREIKKAGSNIYVLDRLELPAVLIECGFLSNYQEAALLRDGDYQNRLSFVLSRAILEYVCPEI